MAANANSVINLDEILEVRRANGLEFEELLSIIFSTCEYLIKTAYQPRYGLFDSESIYITPNGSIEILRLPIAQTPTEYIPPEVRGNPFTEISDAQDVWCLGTIILKALSLSSSDADLLSLLNLMRLDCVSNRPAIVKLLQLTKNRLKDCEMVTKILKDLYKEILGDIDELINDDFSDDVRFSSTRSSLSIIYGPNKRKGQNAVKTLYDKLEPPNMVSESTFTASEAEKTDDTASEERKKISITSSNSIDNTDGKSEHSQRLKPTRLYVKNIENRHMHTNREHNNVHSSHHDNLPASSNASSSLNATTHPNDQSSVKDEIGSNFSRQNSLQPDQIHGRNQRTRRSTNKPITPSSTAPEFVRNSSTPFIRLRARSFKKKGINLHRQEDTIVLVELLDGHSLEVFCKTDVTVSNIFHTVVNHLNIAEHMFFGLALFKNGEYIFLDDDQKLEKWAPIGWWKSASSAETNIHKMRPEKPKFCLKLRFRFYPKKRDFIKTEETVHNLYLQLRRDILEGSLRFVGDKALEMAALALRIECPTDSLPPLKDVPIKYFKLHDYLSKTNDDLINGMSSDQLCYKIAQLHAQFTQIDGGLCRLESKEQFIRLAQAEITYGAHYYRVFKIKPFANKQVHHTYTRHSDMFFVAIMPFGIAICREQANGFRQLTAVYEWHLIRTLQFDRKRFLISTIQDNNVIMDHVFYTDHYSKSSYLVRFSASQHKFMMKMRQWQSTLNRNRSAGTRDVQIERAETSNGIEVSHPNAPELVTHSNGTFYDQAKWKMAENVDQEYIRHCYGSEAVRLTLILEKDPEYGLGLTLVDGQVNDVQGVYVKSVSPTGDGKRKGLQIGDCLVSVNGQSLFNRTRHDAVELVKRCESEVQLEVLRFPSITEVLAASDSTFNNSHDLNIREESSSKAETMLENFTTTESNKPEESNSSLRGRRRLSATITPLPPTPPVNRSSKKIVLHKRQRAVSDFGAIGDNLPFLKSEDLLSSLRHRISDSESDEQSEKGHPNECHGEYNLSDHNSLMYTFNMDDDALDGKSHFEHDSISSPHRSAVKKFDALRQAEITSNNSNAGFNKKSVNLDWTNDLVDIEEADSSNSDEGHSKLFITINRISGQNFGFQIGTTRTDPPHIIVTQINSEPAISSKLMVGDRIISINNISIKGSTQYEVLEILRNSAEKTVLGIERLEPEVTLLAVTLDKSKSDTIGLILSKKLDEEGVFIRSIVQGSLASEEGTLQIGDRIMKVNGKCVSDHNPASIVQDLKDSDDIVIIEVKREV